MTADSRPRLLVLTSTLPAHAADAEPRFVLDLCRHLAIRFDLTLLAPGHPGSNPVENLEGLRVIRYRYAPFRSWETLAYPGAILPKLRNRPWLWLLVPMLVVGLRRRALQLARTEHFDGVHCHWLVPQGYAGLALRRHRDLPFVVTSHGGDIFSLRSRPLKWFMRRILAAASGVTVVSSAIRDHIARDPLLARARCAPAVIPMGVDLSRFNSALRDDEWVRSAGLSRPLIAFAGRLVEKKGVKILLEAMGRDPLRTSAASLAIIGDGPLRPALERQVLAAGLQDRVRFLGSMPHVELARALASADIFCAPSVVEDSGDREGLPTVLCEAAASGLPAVATRVSGIPEVIVHGVTGLLVEAGDPAALSMSLHELAGDEGARNRMGRAARHHIESFAWPEVARRFGDILAAAIDASSKARANG